MKTSDYPVLDLERSFPPELLRQLPFYALIVPRLMQKSDGKGQLYRRTNGRGDPYFELRVSPSTSTGMSKPFTFYIGPMTPEQESLLRKLIDEFNDQRPPSSIEQLHVSQLMLDQLEELRLDAKDIAGACAQATGYRLHGYLLKKTDADTPGEISLSQKSSINTIGPWARDFMAHLIALRKRAFSDPEQSLSDALFILKLLCAQEILLIDMTLRRTVLERISQITISGACRRLSKNETRMLTRRRKVTGIAEKVERGLLNVQHLDRRVEVVA